ncbi:MAG: hypothetical protein IAF58_12240 [Leptolyngbya sp.]|nr:hypothetical protein [Candidatus Melainabacteria bacterium]
MKSCANNNRCHRIILFALAVSCLPNSVFAIDSGKSLGKLQTKTPVKSSTARPVTPSARPQSAVNSKVPFTNAPFPSAPSSDSSSFIWNGQGFMPMNSYRSGYGNYFGGSGELTAREKRGRVIWNGANSSDDTKSQAIMDSQLRFGAEDPKTIDLMWKTAKGFFDEQKYDLAEPLLKELIVTLESHPALADKSVLSDASTKLSTLQSERRRIASGARNPYASRRFTPSARGPNGSSYNRKTHYSSGIWNDPNGATATFGP